MARTCSTVDRWPKIIKMKRSLSPSVNTAKNLRLILKNIHTHKSKEKRLSLRWDLRFCYTALLVVHWYQPISGRTGTTISGSTLGTKRIAKTFGCYLCHHLTLTKDGACSAPGRPPTTRQKVPRWTTILTPTSKTSLNIAIRKAKIPPKKNLQHSRTE